MENQTVLPWFRRARAQTETAPQPSQRPRGPPIRQASIALGRANLLPTQTPAQLQQAPARPPTNITDLPRKLPKSVASPSPPATPILRPIVTTRSPTSPMSPMVIKTPSLTPPPSPKVILSRNSNYQFPVPEPETKIVREENTYNYGAKISSNGTDEQYMKNNSSEATKHMVPTSDTKTPTSPMKNKNGKSFNSAGAAKKDGNDMKLLSLGGHNVGAMMNLSSPYKQHSQKKHLYGNDVQENESESKDGNSSDKIAGNGGMKAKASATMVSSNVQCVNNSVLFNATCAHHSPGVHINYNGWHKPKETNSRTKKDASS